MKSSLPLFICTMVLIQLTSKPVFAQLPIDVKTLTGEEVSKGETDFSKSFSIEFKNNTANSGIEIKVKDNAGNMVLLKKGILETEKAGFKINFNSLQGRSYLVRIEGGGGLNISPIDKISFLYGDKKFSISKKQPAVDESNNNEANAEGSKSNELKVGIELHDAMLAIKYYETLDLTLFTLLAKIKNSTKTDPKEIVALYKGNNFIMGLLTEDKMDKFEPRIEGGGPLAGLAKKALNTDVTSFADGFARFLVKRTKEELSVAFFQHFKDLINDEKYRDVQILFPKTIETLNTIDQEIYQFENYITSLRESFEEDLATLLDHMPEVIEEGRFKAFFEANPNIKYSALVFLSMGKELLNGSHPGEALQQIPEEYVEGFKDKNATGSIKTLQLLSASIRSRGNEKYWTNQDSVKMLLSRDDKELIGARFYLGFVYEKAAGISFSGNDLQTYLNRIAAKENEIKETITFIRQLGQHASNIETALEKIQRKKPEEATIDVYHRLVNSFANLVEHLSGIGSLSYINNPIDKKVMEYLEVSRQAFDFALNIGHKKYGSAVVNVYNIYLRITEKPYVPIDEKIIENPSLFFEDITNKLVDARKKHHDESNDIVLKTVAFIKKYGNFMANVVKAKSSQEVADAIEAVALPVGSATIKRHSQWNIALNAYVGLYLGSEKIKGIDDKSEVNSAGVTAPIGISISHGINWWRKGGWSTSLFISIIDLGAPVAFRFKDEKTEQIPSIELKDIISPGIFASIGFPRFPISCNMGWQSGPLLRKIDPQFAHLASSTYSRWSISFVVDIPIFNFYTKRNE